MNLVKERLSWHKEFEWGGTPWWPMYEEYIENRMSEMWRSSRPSERFFEYVYWLEGKVNDQQRIS